MKTSNRTYSISDADLNVFASNLVINMTRDAVQFALRAVNSAAITSLGVLQSAFEILPADSYYVADITIATESNP